MRFPHNTKIFRGQLDVAPFAGVFFVFLIFLLLHSSLVFTPGVPIRLPESADLPGTDRPTVVVAVDASGQYYFQNQVSDERQLKQQLLAAVAGSQEPITLIVQADKEVRYEILVRLGLLARNVGIREALLATKPPALPGALPAALE